MPMVIAADIAAWSPPAYRAYTAIDTAKARAVPGVHAVLTASDIPGVNDVAPVFSDEPILADGVAEYAGHPVVVIGAETYDLARKAAELLTRPERRTVQLQLVQKEREDHASPVQFLRRPEADHLTRLIEKYGIGEKCWLAPVCKEAEP